MKYSFLQTLLVLDKQSVSVGTIMTFWKKHCLALKPLCTNGIILQRQLCGPLAQAEIPSLAYHTRHQRSLTVTKTEPLEYISGPRPGPPLMPFVSDGLQGQVPDPIHIEARMKDFFVDYNSFRL